MSECWSTFRHGYYEVSNFGVVRRARGGLGAVIGKVRKPHFDKDGYLIVVTTYHGRRRLHKVHQLVANAFIGPCPPGKEVHHKDRRKFNNRYDNLKYVTHARNRQYDAKLTHHEVHEIRRLSATGKYHKQSSTLARRFKAQEGLR